MLDILDLSTSLKSIKDTKLASAVAATGTWGSTQLAAAKQILACHACKPTCFLNAFPHLDTCTSSLCIYDQSGYYRCGASCTWTVPAGATKAKFEVWGAGAFSGAGMCCGGSPWGASGAYATIIIPVTEGCQYVMCGGCATCCNPYCTNHTTAQSGASYITGYGLTNFCAEGGCHNIIRRMCMQRTRLCGTTDCCRWQNPSCTDSGGCICGTSFWCADNSCATCGLIPIFSDKDVTFYGTPFGHNSLHGSTCTDTNIYGYDVHPPLVAPDNGRCTAGCCCFTYDSGTCAGKCFNANAGYSCQPGMGGYPTHVMGGCTSSICGGWGRMGMAKVSWI